MEATESLGLKEASIVFYVVLGWPKGRPKGRPKGGPKGEPKGGPKGGPKGRLTGCR